MKWLFLMTVALGTALAGGTPGQVDPPATNINSRYTIEKVSISGWQDRLISHPLRAELDHFVGEKLDQTRLERIASRMKKELRAADVAVKVTKGSMPEHVLVTFEVKARQQRFDLSVAKFLYDSKQGWSGEGTATTHAGGNAFTVGLASDGDAQLERYAGVRFRFDREHLGRAKIFGTDRLGLRFEFDSFHDQWNRATLAAVDSAQADAAVEPVTYRSRQVFTPEARLYLAEPLELDFGVRFARYRPSTPGANPESSNAVVSTLRYHQRWGSDGDSQQELDGSYAFEDATQILESDHSYTRHVAKAHYMLRHGRSILQVGFLAGRIIGQAPLFDRFVLGNASTLRGWNKFQLDPVGGSRVVHGSIDYAYRILQIFYDTGAVWDRAQNREQKQSLGGGFKKDNFQLAIAFPVRAGHADPVFFAGMNF